MAVSTNMPDLRTRLTLDISDFTTGLVHARGEARLFGREVEGLGSHFKAAGIAMATLATISLFTAGIIASGFLVAIGTIMTLGVVSASQSVAVQASWQRTTKAITDGMLKAARSYVPVLIRLSDQTRQMFARVEPALTAVFDRLAPIFEDMAMNFLGFLEDTIMGLPASVDHVISFLQDVGPAWDQMTDNMRAGWNRVYDAVLEFGPTILKEGLPPFGIFVGGVLGMLSTIVEAGGQIAGPFFQMLGEVAVYADATFANLVGQIVGPLTLLGPTLSNLGRGLVDLIGGMGPGLVDLIIELTHLGPIVADLFRGLSPTLNHLLGVVADSGAVLMPVFEVIQRFLINLGPVLVAFGHMFVSVLGGFVEGLAPLLAAMGASDWSEAMIMGIEAITPGLTQLAFLFGSFVSIVVFGGGAILNAISSVVQVFASMTGIFGSLGENAGKALVVGIIGGILFMVSPLLGVLGGLLAAVAMFMPNPFVGGGGTPGMPSMPPPAPASSFASNSSAQNITVNVHGSVLSERDLQTVVQDSALQSESRNGGSTIATSVR